MDMSRFKPGQRACVTTLDSALAVSAGAGSGKTFTLTQRIAWALMEGSGPDGRPFLDDIGEVLAITFTDKAAGEIKSRVKSTLRAEGMADQALRVDDAWISTIHGMCSRILRTHALELGIDPAFSVLDEAGAAALLDEALEEALACANEFIAPEGLDALFAEYPARKTGSFDAASIEDMVRTLVMKASASPNGMDSFAMPPKARSATKLVSLMESLIAMLAGMVEAQKPGARRDAWLAQAQDYLERSEQALARKQVNPADVIKLFSSCPWPSAGFGTKPYKESAKECQAQCADLVREARSLYAEPLLADLVRLAGSVFASYREKKRAAGFLDNDDLLIMTDRALREHPGIAERYASKFKLVMVDEFQDTDQLQVDMIGRIAGASGERLCVVGDAQQSIYRFRGADVSVYRRHLAAVRALNPDGIIELPDNFRSHADVLRFVDRVFEQPSVFGDSFMSLAASRNEASVKHPFKGDRRVDVLLSTYPARKGVSASDMRAFEARRIARRFAELRSQGHAAGEMVVLLGRMTMAQVYAEALRAEGFACVIAGGSIFAQAPEVRVMQRLVEVIANPRATAALFELLSSDMFALSADDFVELSTAFDEDAQVDKRRNLDEGFRTLARALDEGAHASEPLEHAVRIMRALATRVGREPVSAIMTFAVRESGWLSRLQRQGAEGQSVAANILKAIRVIEGFERDGMGGAASLSAAFSAHLAMAKEAPGALSAEGGDFVRIMTVHASKGLEFPLVAIAEMGLTDRRSAAFSCETIQGTHYISLEPRNALAQVGSTNPLKKCMEAQYSPLGAFEYDLTEEAIAHADAPALRVELVAAYAREQELQERRRLLYVALTRAKEALVVGMITARSSEGDFTSGATTGVFDDMRSALFGYKDIPEGVSRVDFGGSCPAFVERIDVDAEGPWAQQGSDQPEEQPDVPPAAGISQGEPPANERSRVALPVIRRTSRPFEVPYAPLRERVVSYSSLAQTEQASAEAPAPAIEQAPDAAQMPDDSDAYAVPACGGEGERGPQAHSEGVGFDDQDEAFWDALCASLSEDADKATDVGTAFHHAAQRAAAPLESEGCDAAPRRLCMPDTAAVDAIARSCKLGPESRSRVFAALRRWVRCDVARTVEAYPFVRSEFAFFAPFVAHDGSTGFFEGSIDLFAAEAAPDAAAGNAALIVDYKTGGHPDETPVQLREKHLLQAQCYAYAVLRQGYAAVDAVFVRVEQEDEGTGQPECVRYRFSSSDQDDLLERIRRAFADR